MQSTPGSVFSLFLKGGSHEPPFLNLLRLRMLPLFKHWLRRTGLSDTPPWDLSSYPPNGPLHVGYASELSEGQARDNLVHFQATLGLRMQHARTWLLEHDGPDPQALHGNDYARSLDAWAKRNWRRLPPAKRLTTHQRWPRVPRDGAHIVYSLLSDLALTLGEAVRHANADWRWGLNWDAIDLSDGMLTSRRVVLLAELRAPTPETREAVIDFESLVVHDYEHPESPNFMFLDDWARTAADAISGAYHRY